MSQSRFVLKQIHVRLGSSNGSELTRYIAKSKLDNEREGKGARPIFTERDDNLTVSQARKYLSIIGDSLNKEDVLHYVLSFASEREYELLGDSEEVRRSETARYLRASLQNSFAQIGTLGMRWAAAVHRNTDNPHLHLILNKNAVNKKTGHLIRINRFPSPLIAHNRVLPDGGRIFSYGTIISNFAEKVDMRLRERTRFLQVENILNNVRFTRELLSPEILKRREPTKEEMLIGDWLMAEIKAARLNEIFAFKGVKTSDIRAGFADEMKANESNESNKRLSSLREEVHRIDRDSLARDGIILPAFIDSESLCDALVDTPLGTRVTSLNGTESFEKTPHKELSLDAERQPHPNTIEFTKEQTERTKEVEQKTRSHTHLL